MSVDDFFVILGILAILSLPVSLFVGRMISNQNEEDGNDEEHFESDG